jgi:hypothetical protein
VPRVATGSRTTRRSADAWVIESSGRGDSTQSMERASPYERRLCSLVSRANGEDPIGSATPVENRLAVELPQPWQRDAVGSRRLVEGLRPVVEGARDGGLLDAFSAILPDREYSRKGHTRLLFFRRPAGPFALYEKVDLLVPHGEVVAAAGALLEGLGVPPRFGRYRQETGHVRDLLVCTHGSRDVCCGKYGYPVYDLLRRRRAEAERLRVWRTSHIGGHRFAPTMIDYSEGRYWGHLEPWAAEKVAARSGPVLDLGPFYRGWSGLQSSAEQVAEREIFAREGWAWTGYLKEGRVLASGDGRIEVRIAYRSRDGAVSGAYEATVEVAGTVMTLESSGNAELTEVDQYRVVRLEKSPEDG